MFSYSNTGRPGPAKHSSVYVALAVSSNAVKKIKNPVSQNKRILQQNTIKKAFIRQKCSKLITTPVGKGNQHLHAVFSGKEATSDWLADHGITVLDWPLPDMNPIENLWSGESAALEEDERQQTQHYREAEGCYQSNLGFHKHLSSATGWSPT